MHPPSFVYTASDFVLLSEVARNEGSSEALFLLRGGSKANSYQYFGGVIISAGLDCDKLEKTIQLVAKEIQGLGDKTPGRAEFNRVLELCDWSDGAFA